MGFRNFFSGRVNADGELEGADGAWRIKGRAHALAPGAAATAAIRPEDVQVGADASVNRFNGRVEIVEYLGRENEGVLRLEDQSSLWVHTPVRLAPGETVPVTFPPDKVIFLPAEAP
jgi:ABC-type Fe3+/spermidine/putrescine transport system ATPase subunit